MKIAIVGSRNFIPLNAVREFVRQLPLDTIVVSGGARGVDTAAETEAVTCGLGTEIYPAQWDTLGKRAGYVRNQQIVDACDELVAFWDGSSRGTQHSLELARKQNKPVRVMRME